MGWELGKDPQIYQILTDICLRSSAAFRVTKCVQYDELVTDGWSESSHSRWIFFNDINPPDNISKLLHIRYLEFKSWDGGLQSHFTCTFHETTKKKVNHCLVMHTSLFVFRENGSISNVIYETAKRRGDVMYKRGSKPESTACMTSRVQEIMWHCQDVFFLCSEKALCCVCPYKPVVFLVADWTSIQGIKSASDPVSGSGVALDERCTCCCVYWLVCTCRGIVFQYTLEAIPGLCLLWGHWHKVRGHVTQS